MTGLAVLVRHLHEGILAESVGTRVVRTSVGLGRHWVISTTPGSTSSWPARQLARLSGPRR